MIFNIGGHVGPRIYVNRNGEPILLLDGKSRGMGGESNLVLKISEALSGSSYVTFRADRICNSIGNNRRCSKNILNPSVFDVEISSVDFCS